MKKVLPHFCYRQNLNKPCYFSKIGLKYFPRVKYLKELTERNMKEMEIHYQDVYCSIKLLNNTYRAVFSQIGKSINGSVYIVEKTGDIFLYALFNACYLGVTVLDSSIALLRGDLGSVNVYLNSFRIRYPPLFVLAVKVFSFSNTQTNREAIKLWSKETGCKMIMLDNHVCVEMPLYDRTIKREVSQKMYQTNLRHLLQLSIEILEKVSSLHEKKKTHGNLKSSNIVLVDEPRRIELVDHLGPECLFIDQEYKSIHEKFRQGDEFTKQMIDVFSLGCVFIELIYTLIDKLYSFVEIEENLRQDEDLFHMCLSRDIEIHLHAPHEIKNILTRCLITMVQTDVDSRRRACYYLELFKHVHTCLENHTPFSFKSIPLKDRLLPYPQQQIE